MKSNGIPRIESVKPGAALAGGDISIHGSGFGGRNHIRPSVQFGETEANVVMATDTRLIVRVPEGAASGTVSVRTATDESQPFPVSLGLQVADNLHPVANPAVDAEGNVFVTYSGQRGQKVPVSLYRITPNNVVKPYVTDLVNPTGLALDREGNLYVSCRHDGTIQRIGPDGRASQWIEGMGIATGLAFDAIGNLYVGDRSGTIFKIHPDRQIFVFATLEPSVAAYHLAFHPSGDLYVTGPTTSSFDRVYRVNPAGEVHVFYRGLGRPQGLAFDEQGNLHVAASLGGQRGIVRISPKSEAELVVSGNNVVGMALTRTRRTMIVTNAALFSLDWDVRGLPLVG